MTPRSNQHTITSCERLRRTDQTNSPPPKTNTVRSRIQKPAHLAHVLLLVAAAAVLAGLACRGDTKQRW